jgi:hypothetical protein
MQAVGRIIAILPAQSGVSARSGNQWCAQTFVLETVEQYPKKIPFEVFGADKIQQFNIQMNEMLTIHFDIDGREWNGKWFPKISCYNVERQVQQQPPQAAYPQQPPMQPQAQPMQYAPYPPQQQQYVAPQQKAAAPAPQQDQGGGSDQLPF